LCASSLLLLLFVTFQKDSDLESEQELVDNSESTVDDTLSSNSGDHETSADYVLESSSEIPVVLNGSPIMGLHIGENFN